MYKTDKSQHSQEGVFLLGIDVHIVQMNLFLPEEKWDAANIDKTGSCVLILLM